MQLIVPAIFNMQPSDSALFKGRIEHGMFDTALSVLKRDSICNYKFRWLDPSENLVLKYKNIYDRLEWDVEVHYLCGIIYKKHLSYKNVNFGTDLKLSSENNIWHIINKLTTPFASKLIKKHPIRYLKLYFSLAKSSFGDWSFIVFYFGIFTLSIVNFFYNKMAILISMACLLFGLNILLVCAVGIPWGRYMFYTNYFLFAALSIAAAKSLENGLFSPSKENSDSEKDPIE